MDKPTYRQYKKCLNEPGRLIKTEDGRVYYESTPYRFKYTQIVLFIIFTIVLLVAVYILTNYLAKFNDILTGNLIYLSYVLTGISIMYFYFSYNLFLDKNLIRYLFAGFKRFPDERAPNHDVSVKKPTYIDIMLDTIKPTKTEHKDEIRKNFIYCPGGRVFEEKRFSAFYTAWDIIWHLSIFVLIVFILLYTYYIVFNAYLAWYIFSAFSIYSLCLYFVFPVLRWRLGRFEEVDINEINREEEYQSRPIIE